MEENFLEIKDLKKSFGTGEAKQDVLRGMDFSVSKGTIRLPYDRALPSELIARIAEWCMNQYGK